MFTIFFNHFISLGINLFIRGKWEWATVCMRRLKGVSPELLLSLSLSLSNDVDPGMEIGLSVLAAGTITYWTILLTQTCKFLSILIAVFLFWSYIHSTYINIIDFLMKQLYSKSFIFPFPITNDFYLNKWKTQP